MTSSSHSKNRLGAAFDSKLGTRRYFSFRDIETHVLSHLSTVQSAGYTCIVAIARGGLYAGAMLSQYSGLPLVLSTFDRATCQAKLTIGCGDGQKLLLVDDIAGMGHTLSATKAHLESLGWQVDTFVNAWDALSRNKPTYGMEVVDARPVWPWERGILGNQFSSDRKTADPDAWVRAFDLDGVFLPDVDTQLYATNLEEALRQRQEMPAFYARPSNWSNDGTAFIVSARLQSEQRETETWLSQHGVRSAGVFLRESLEIGPAQHKAMTILSLGVTEFVESELLQAQEISRLVPYCVVWHYDALTGELARVD